MSKFIAMLLIAIFSPLGLGAASVSAQDFPDLKGVWTGTYTTVSPHRDGTPGPRFNPVEWRLEIEEQQGDLLFGKSTWSPESSDTWNERTVTGSISFLDTNVAVLSEFSVESGVGVTGLINATLHDGKLYVSFRGLRTGAAFSTVLTRAAP